MQNLFLILGAAAVVLCSPVLLLAAQSRPSEGEVALVIAPPWGESAAVIAAKNGLLEVTPERAPMGALVLLQSPHSIDQLYNQGAWLVVDGKRVLELCAN
ncbi:hypothetical protein RSK20926_00590 [Roseobacter sp. SK209-2-6]|uniref:hypothetical protein n=1 Tax=Roseobacter sp. SK209-2-6 TaxID=388739 RepID=UPI0000F3C28B|nr:hypothetical protein [Roseobacter sp. SK209-2-6]EBA15404.1 hypothetical protein RSK20926_00590 [Roseobacter sp. SK209-2-6]